MTWADARMCACGAVGPQQRWLTCWPVLESAHTRVLLRARVCLYGGLGHNLCGFVLQQQPGGGGGQVVGGGHTAAVILQRGRTRDRCHRH
jgi:hypothetical protein